MKSGKWRIGILILVTHCVSLSLLLMSWAADPSGSAAQTAAPPPKVFDDGTPWVAVDQEAALKRAREVPRAGDRGFRRIAGPTARQLGNKARRWMT